MEDGVKSFQTQPLKLYIQDIFRAERTPQNKYKYELFGLIFKNINIQGVITAVYNKLGNCINLEVSDPTGTVQIYYDCSKHNYNIPTEVAKRLHQDFTQKCRFTEDNTGIKLKMLDTIASTKQKALDFEEGSYVNVVGDIFVDELRDIRMVSAFHCKVTSIEYDIVWLEELRYLYEKFYLREKVE